MENLIYCPVIKLKENEIKYLGCLNKDFVQDDVLPYLEFISDPFDQPNQRRKKNPYPYHLIDAVVFSLPKDKKFFGDIYHFDSQITNNCGKPFLLKNKDPRTYFNSLASLIRIPQCIPSFLIENDFALQYALSFIRKCHDMGRPVAIRSTTFASEVLKPILDVLTKDDYFFVDISLTAPENQGPMFEDIFSYSPSCSVVLLSRNRIAKPAPILSDFKDGSLEKTRIARDRLYFLRANPALKFAGFADYCGQKDDLATGGNGNDYSRTAFFYSYPEQGFHIVQDPDTNSFSVIKSKCLDQRPVWDPQKKCPAFDLIDSVNNNAMGFWWMVCLIRYVDQIVQNLN